MNLTKKQENFIIIGGIGFIIITIIGALIHDFVSTSNPPPIIVKGGNSFIIVSPKPIEETSKENYFYKIDNYGYRIRGIKIKKTTGTPEIDTILEDKDGFEIDIKLQKEVNLAWVDIPTLTTIRAKGFWSWRDYVMETSEDLQQKDNPPAGYQDHWGDNGAYKLRFGKIIVRDSNNTELPTPETANGDNYEILIYNYLPIPR